MIATPDKYTSGMSAFTSEETLATPEYDRSQFELVRPFLGRRILEVGAGAGRITQLVDKIVSPAELVIAEPSAHFAPILREKFAARENVRVLQSEIGRLEYRDHFDTILGVCVLEHIEDDRHFLSECRRAVAPGGRIVFVVPAFQFLYSTLDRNVGHFRRYDRPMLKALARNTELELEHLAYSNLVGFFGSLYFSKLRKVNYQESRKKREQFFRLYSFFSQNVVPIASAVERIVPVPFGLSLVVVYRRRT